MEFPPLLMTFLRQRIGSLVRFFLNNSATFRSFICEILVPPFGKLEFFNVEQTPVAHIKETVTTFFRIEWQWGKNCKVRGETAKTPVSEASLVVDWEGA